jgi:hypothetical protein
MRDIKSNLLRNFELQHGDHSGVTTNMELGNFPIKVEFDVEATSNIMNAMKQLGIKGGDVFSIHQTTIVQVPTQEELDKLIASLAELNIKPQESQEVEMTSEMLRKASILGQGIMGAWWLK